MESGIRARLPSSMNKKPGKIASWVARYSGLDILHKKKDCSGRETQLKDCLALYPHTAKEQFIDEVRAVCSFTSVPTAASQTAFNSLWGCDGLGSGNVWAHGTAATLGHCPSGSGNWAVPEVSVLLGNQMSDQVSRDSRSKFTMAPGSGCLNVSFNWPAVSSAFLLSID